MGTSHGIAFVFEDLESVEERLDIKFHNENVAVTGFGVVQDEIARKVLFAINTPKGIVQLELTPAISARIASELARATSLL